MVLNDASLRNAKPRDKAYRINGDRGLFAEVRPTGRISLRGRYRFNGRDSLITFGEWPYLSLIEAEEKMFELRKMIAHGIDPALAAKAEKTAQKLQTLTFADVARDWLAKKMIETNSEKNKYIITMRLEKHILPAIGEMPPDEINAPLLLMKIVRPIEAAGHYETAHKVIAQCGQIFRYAIATGHATRDPSADLRGALIAAPSGHYAHIIDAKKFGALLRAIDGYEGSPIVRGAMRLLSYTFVRPGELRHAEWTEIDLDAAEWKIPAEKMKMKRPHIVPLSRQAVETLAAMRSFTGAMRYVFPSARSYTGTRPMSDVAIHAALRSMGFTKGDMTAHGFRHSASTFLNESALWSSDAIERQLSHIDSDKIRATYNYAEYLPERRKMMQWWADWCDEQRESVG